GSNRASRRIVSAAACSQTPQQFSYQYYAGPFALMKGGYVQAAAYENLFSANCPSQAGAGRFVQIGLGPNIGSTVNLTGCRNANSVNSWQYVQPTLDGGGNPQEWPLKTLTFSPSSPTALICEMKNHPTTGDGKVFSYRTSSTGTF
ncbi:MAG TPA: hypothetical protein VFH73_28955, partial [Polyangia bacterium]|nr:hypothetical protein [Polyangia bacterium]